MNINEILKNIDIVKAFIGLIFASGVLQISPVKVNPYSMLVKWVGDVACTSTKEDLSRLLEKIDNLENKQKETDSKLNASILILQQSITKLEKDGQERNMEDIRRHILDFYEKLISGIKPTKDSFRSILSDIDKYEDYCENHETFKNGYTVEAVKVIQLECAKIMSISECQK